MSTQRVGIVDDDDIAQERALAELLGENPDEREAAIVKAEREYQDLRRPLGRQA